MPIIIIIIKLIARAIRDWEIIEKLIENSVAGKH